MEIPSMRPFLALWLLSSLALASFAQPPAPIRYTTPQFQRMIDQLVDEQVRADHFSGVILAVKDGQTIYSRATGIADKNCDAPITMSTRFNLGIASRIFPRAAIAQLADQGKLAITDTLGKYLHDIPAAESWWSATIDEATKLGTGTDLFLADQAHGIVLKSQLRELKDYLPIISKVGAHPRKHTDDLYVSAGCILAGMVIERITGQNFFDYMRQYFFEQIGMDSTGHYDLDNLPPNTAIGYTYETEFMGEAADTTKPRHSNIYLHPARGNSSGEAYSTAPDLLRFIQALEQGRVASPELTRWILGQGLPGSQAAQTGRDKPAPVPIELSLFALMPGIDASIFCDASSHSTIIVLSNYDPHAAYDLALQIRSRLPHVRD